jgi:hypothetical protein
MALITFKKGAAAGIPTLAAGEPGFTTDTFALYIGTAASGNKLIGPGAATSGNNTWTGTNSFNGLVDVQEDFRLSGDISVTLDGTPIDDWAPTGLSTACVIKVSASGDTTISGLTGGADGRVICIVQDTPTLGSDVILTHEDTGSSAANRFSFNTGQDTRLSPGDTCILWYDSGSSYWRMISGLRNGGVTNAKISDRATCSVMGRSANSTGAPADIQVDTNGKFVVRRSDAVTADVLLASDLPTRVEETWIGADSMQARSTNAPASAVYTVGGAGGADVLFWGFDSSSAEVVQWTGSLPAGWNAGTVAFRAYWSHGATTTDFGIVFKLRAVSAGDGEDLAAPSTATNQAVVDTGGVTDRTYVTAYSSAITIAGSPTSDDLIVWELFRDPASGSDTLAVDGRLIGIKLRWTRAAGDDS